MPEWIAKYWVEWAFGVVAGVLIWLYKRLAQRLKKNREENEELRNGVRALLMRSIAEDCEEAQKKGFCTLEKKKIINSMYTSYHALGGNDVITEMKNGMMRLPTEPQEAA